MSEDLQQSQPKDIGQYKYLQLGSTTLSQLKRAGIIPGKIPAQHKARKPDGIIYLPKGHVKAVVEVKNKGKLTSSQLPKIVNQWADTASLLCNLLIVTDGAKAYWVNPHTKQEIMDASSRLRADFPIAAIASGKLKLEDANELSELVERCDQSVDPENNILGQKEIVDPSQLAQTVWQKIWITTGKEPEKCLYNVVEIIVFKFLSDIGVLNGSYSFGRVVEELSESNPDEALIYYAKLVRGRIQSLFPPSPEDHTTIINGTIFVNESGEPNLSQKYLFNEVIEEFQKFEDKYGSFRNIGREFKTRLYETFLRQSAGIKSLGQYFTPRSVVQAMVRMARLESLPPNARICDPFCGVGGFLLEALVENKNLLKEFRPKNGRVRPRVTIRGYDKGTDEKDDERTIILAKANMLIYFTELLAKHNSEKLLKEYSDNAFNAVFRLLKSNLGTFAQTQDEKYDVILTNPPYVTSGSASLKQNIRAEGLDEYYEPIGRGTEAIAVQWIVKNLSDNGVALVVVPDGLLNQYAVLDYLKNECIVEGVVSLPSRTFFSTVKQTYILAIRKRREGIDEDQTPVFAYLVSEIGESRDARRISIEQNDLGSLVDEFLQFSGSKATYKTSNPRVKLIPANEFDGMRHWMIERLWSKEEKEALGIIDDVSEVSEDEFLDLLTGVSKDISKFMEEVGQG